MAPEQDAAVVRAFVRDVCTKGIRGDSLAPSDVIAVKFEYDFDSLDLIACQVSRDRFGDVTARIDLGSGRTGLVEGASQLPEDEFDLDLGPPPVPVDFDHWDERSMP